MDIKRYAAQMVPEHMVPRLEELTLGAAEGYMHGAFHAARKQSTRGVCYVGFVDDHIVGWCLRWQYINFRTWHCYLFVDKNNRRMGYGTQLLEAAAKPLRVAKAHVTAWNEASTGFFEKASHDHPKLLIRYED